MIVQRKGPPSPREQVNSLLPPPPVEKNSFLMTKEEAKRLTIMTGGSSIDTRQFPPNASPLSISNSINKLRVMVQEKKKDFISLYKNYDKYSHQLNLFDQNYEKDINITTVNSTFRKYIKAIFSDHQMPKDLASLAAFASAKTPERTLQTFLSRQIAFLQSVIETEQALQQGKPQALSDLKKIRRFLQIESFYCFIFWEYHEEFHRAKELNPELGRHTGGPRQYGNAGERMSVNLDMSSVLPNGSSVVNVFLYARLMSTFKRYRQLLYSLNYLLGVLGRKQLIDFIDHIRTFTLDSYHSLLKQLGKDPLFPPKDISFFKSVLVMAFDLKSKNYFTNHDKSAITAASPGDLSEEEIDEEEESILDVVDRFAERLKTYNEYIGLVEDDQDELERASTGERNLLDQRKMQLQNMQGSIEDLRRDRQLSKINEITSVAEASDTVNYDTKRDSRVEIDDMSEEEFLAAMDMSESLSILKKVTHIEEEDEEDEVDSDDDEDDQELKEEGFYRAVEFLNQQDDPFFQKLLNEDQAELNYIYQNMPQEASSLPQSIFDHILKSPNNPYARWANFTAERTDVQKQVQKKLQKAGPSTMLNQVIKGTVDQTPDTQRNVSSLAYFAIQQSLEQNQQRFLQKVGVSQVMKAMFTQKRQSVAKKQQRRDQEEEKIDISENADLDQTLQLYRDREESVYSTPEYVAKCVEKNMSIAAARYIGTRAKEKQPMQIQEKMKSIVKALTLRDSEQEMKSERSNRQILRNSFIHERQISTESPIFLNEISERQRRLLMILKDDRLFQQRIESRMERERTRSRSRAQQNYLGIIAEGDDDPDQLPEKMEMALMSDVMRSKKAIKNKRLIRENSITDSASDLLVNGEDLVIRPKAGRHQAQGGERRKPGIIIPSKRSSREGGGGAGTTTADSDTASLYLQSDGSVEMRELSPRDHRDTTSVLRRSIEILDSTTEGTRVADEQERRDSIAAGKDTDYKPQDISIDGISSISDDDPKQKERERVDSQPKSKSNQTSPTITPPNYKSPTGKATKLKASRRTSLNFGQGARKGSIISEPMPIAQIEQTPNEENDQHSDSEMQDLNQGSKMKKQENVISVRYAFIDQTYNPADVHPPVDLNKTLIKKRLKLGPPNILLSPVESETATASHSQRPSLLTADHKGMELEVASVQGESTTPSQKIFVLTDEINEGKKEVNKAKQNKRGSQLHQDIQEEIINLRMKQHKEAKLKRQNNKGVFEFELEEEDDSELDSESFKNQDSVLRDQQMQQAYGGWIGSQVNVATLGSLNHFKNLHQRNQDSETPKSQASQGKKRVKNLEDLKNVIKQRKMDKKMAKLLRQKLEQVNNDSNATLGDVSVANSSDMY